MSQLDKVSIETIINIFKVENGILQILLFRKQEEPYKGYWMLPNHLMKLEQTLEDSVQNNLQNFLGYSEIYFKQLTVFSDIARVSDNRTVGVSYLGFTDSITEQIKFHIKESVEYNWFSINNIPKMAYDHNNILLQAIKTLKKEVENVSILSMLYPSDFTLPEVQKMLENLLQIPIDRRNFRKKLINKGWIKQTGETIEGGTGRPGKLYYFCKDIKEEQIF